MSVLVMFIVTSCSGGGLNFGLTAKTYNGFNKSQAEQYNYVLKADEITYRDKNGNNIILSEEEKNLIVKNVNQCLVDFGYSNKNKEKKVIELSLDLYEKETKNSEIYYDVEFLKRFKEDGYNISQEPYLGPRNKNFLILRSDDYENFLNYKSKGEFWFVGLPYYSKFGGTQYVPPEVYLLDDLYHRIETDSCDKRSTGRFCFLCCMCGKADLSHFYAKLAAKEGNETKFDVILHHQINIIKTEKKIKKYRKRIINLLSKYICLFIADNADDLMIVTIKNGRNSSLFASDGGRLGGGNYVGNFYPRMKAELNNANGNRYFIIDRENNKRIKNIYSDYSNPSCVSDSAYMGANDNYCCKKNSNNCDTDDNVEVNIKQYYKINYVFNNELYGDRIDRIIKKLYKINYVFNNELYGDRIDRIMIKDYFSSKGRLVSKGLLLNFFKILIPMDRLYIGNILLYD